MGDTKQSPVKIFISYSWSSPTHESWVLMLATRLRQDGINAILDKWDLQHGHDALKFMEQMVTDSTVKKVLMVCDRVYTEKANNREGGVGAESQIISPELYGKATQDKFAAAITELNEEGKAYVPIFYKGRIYFDFSSDEKYEEQYESLLRWILSKPLHIKPSIGSVPLHIEGGVQFAPATESKLRRLVEAIRQGSPGAAGLLREFSDAFVSDFKQLRLFGFNVSNFDDKIVESIEGARPYIEQLTNIAVALARFAENSGIFDDYIRLLERLARFMFQPEQVGTYTDWDLDNYKYLCREIFLITVAVLLNEERFDVLQRVLMHPYWVETDRNDGRATLSFDVFDHHLKSLESRNQRLQMNKINIGIDMLDKAHTGRNPSFIDLMQADFVLYLQNAIAAQKTGTYQSWFPSTLAYATNRYRPFAVFARSESKAYFSRLAPILGVDTPQSFANALEILTTEMSKSYSGYRRIPIGRLSNAKNIGAVG
jgi:hypothetical protein